MAGAPPGNQNRNKARLWDQALTALLEKRGITRLEALGEVQSAMLDKAKGGDIQAAKEWLDREMGKSIQNVVVEGGDEPVRIQLTASEALTSKIRGLVTLPEAVSSMGASGEGAKRSEGTSED